MANPTHQLREQYKGWPVFSLANPWIRLQVAPELGGRILQISLDDYPFLFENAALEGVMPGPDGLGEEGAWLNFGGEKIWPAPQGWGLPGHWPGPPDPVLDSGAYTVDWEDREGLRLTSPVDPVTGLQISRTITVSDLKAEICINASFTNKGTDTREWSIWPVIQMNAGDLDYPGRYQVICPANPFSRFEDGYTVMHGVVNSPQFKRNSSGNVEIDFQYLIGKVGMDSVAGWMAYSDRTTGKVMVIRYNAYPQASYPENTSVQVWTQGRGMIYSRNRITEFPGDVTVNPPYLEMELLGPLENLRPGTASHFEYSLSTCTIPSDCTVLQVTENVVVAGDNFEIGENGDLRVSVKLGAVLAGWVRLKILDSGRYEIRNSSEKYWRIDPVSGLEIDAIIAKQDLANASWVSIRLYDINGRFIETISENQLVK